MLIKTCMIKLYIEVNEIMLKQNYDRILSRLKSAKSVCMKCWIRYWKKKDDISLHDFEEWICDIHPRDERCLVTSVSNFENWVKFRDGFELKFKKYVK